MAKLSNSPRQSLNFDLERRKSYSFKFVMRHVDGTLVDLTGCTIRFVMKPLGADEDVFDLNNLLVNNEATLGTTGEGLFAFQAAELDGDPGEYPYAIVMWTADNYSSVLMKGTVNLVDNTESLSMYRQFGVTSPEAALELTLRQGDVVQVVAASMVKVFLGQDGGAPTVDSVAGRTGNVVLSSADLTDVNSLVTDAELAAGLVGKANAAHTHDITDVSGLQSALAGKQPTGSYAASSHTHDITDVSGLQSALAGKQPTGSYAASTHTHTASEITDLTETVQDAVGAMVAGAGGTYDDGAGTITLPSGGGGGGDVLSLIHLHRTAGWAASATLGTHANVTLTSGRLVPCPQIVRTAVTATKVGIHVETAVAGSSVELALYTMSSDGSTATLVATLGTVGTSTTGPKTITGLSQPLTAGAHLVVARPIGGNPVVWGRSGGFLLLTTGGPSAGTSHPLFPNAASPGSMPATITWDFNAGVYGNTFPLALLGW